MGISLCVPPWLADETRISNNELKHQHLQKNEVDIAFAYIQTWPQR